MPKCGIFLGRFGDDDAVWLESVEGLETPFNRMKEIATERPGKCFIFSATTKTAIESSDRTKEEWLEAYL